MQVITSKSELLNALEKGGVVITPNNRLSAALSEDYFHQSPLETVDKPHCLPFNSFIRQCYEALQLSMPLEHPPYLLNQHQCRHLWQNVLKKQDNLTFSKGLLSSVMEAWSRLVQWQVSPNHEAFSHSPQCQQFQTWWQAFHAQLNELNALCEEQLLDYLLDIKAPFTEKTLIWASFDEFTPQQLRLQEELSRQGIGQFHYDLYENQTNHCQFAAKDHEDEFQQLIQWLHQQMEAGCRKIAVVIPDLQQRARPLQRQLKRYISPALYNLSLGQSLTEYPLVSHALNWLNLKLDQLSHEQGRLLLSSPYLKGSKEELHQRAQCIQDSPLLQTASMPFKQWLKQLSNKTPILKDCLDKLQAYPESASPNEWVDIFHQRLQTLGYPGDYGLYSENYQCFQRFSELFNSFRQLNLLSNALTATEALDALNDLVQQTIFQPQTTLQKPIQISGLLEASGCEFDSLWIMGLTDQCLPQKTRLSSFIPHPLQKELNMPHSSPERELAFAKKLLERFKKASPHNVFSYPKMSGDTPNLPSPLIGELPLMPPLPIEETEQAALSRQAMEDDYKIPLEADEQMSKGSALLANQAKCPFRAFAAHRLNAKAANALSEGFDHRERGQIVHSIMEVIWKELGSQAQLLSLSQSDLDACIESAIKTALNPFINKHQHSSELLQDIELNRLKPVIQRCLDWEKERPPFEIHAIEQDYQIQLDNIDFKIRVDRLDSVENDKKWLIDYKSTIPASNPWKEERPKEPQLLLYALLDETINTLLFVQLKAGQLESKSFSEEKLNLKGNSSIKKDEHWEDYRQHWHEQLTSLAKEFNQGHCPPQPLSRSICEQCDFESLCRFKLS